MLNRVIIMGRLTKDPELRTTPQGTPVATFTVAVDRRYTPKGEEKKTDFINVVAWRQNAEFVSKYFAKGRVICVQGELQSRSYVDKDNNTRYITEVVADSLHFTGEARTGGSATTGANTYTKVPHPAESINDSDTLSVGSASDFVETDDSDEDYPF